MQTFHFDLSTKSNAPVLNVKQCDVGRKFKAVITDGGMAYNIPAGAQFSVWYSGPSGQGNYSDFGGRSAFSVSGNTIIVELITQMIQNAGTGTMCLVMNDADGSQMGLWNLVYVTECVPGAGSTEAEQYFTAFSAAAEKLSSVEALLKSQQLKPEFANSIEECTDTSKLYVLPDGYIYAYMATAEANYTNQIKQSINADGTQYVGENGEDGYKKNYRLNSSGGETAQAGVNVTGFISAGDGDTIYFKNVPYKPGAGLSTEYLVIYNSSFTQVIGVRASEDMNNVAYLVSAYTTDENGYLTSVTLNDKYGTNDMSYIRICATGLDNSAVITVNEKITESVGYSWKNTGHAFVPADYEDRILVLEKAVRGDIPIYGIVDSDNNIFLSGSLVAGTYTMKYLHEDGSTSDICEFTME